MEIQRWFFAVTTVAIALGIAGIASANILINPGFEDGIGDTGAWWTNIAGPSGNTSSRNNNMPSTGSSGAYMQADHIANPAAVTPYGVEQLQPVGTIDDSLNYNLSFSAKADSSDFTGFDMTYEILWLDGDVSHGGGVLSRDFASLIPAGLNANYQTFSVNSINPPTGADSFRLRFELLPGAVANVANGLYIDDVVLEVDGGGPGSPVEPGNILLNPSFETGIGDTAAFWTNIAGPSGSTTGTAGMPNTGSSGAYMQADHFANPAAVTPYGIEQLQPIGTIDDSLNYDLSFSAKADSDSFAGFDMIYQILWLDGDVSHGGGVLGEVNESLIPAGLNTNYQTFSFNDLDVPEGADSFRLRFEILPGADPDIANGLHIDDVVLKIASPSSSGDFDGDDDVDGADFLEWQRTDGTTAGLSLWESNYRASFGSTQVASAVPEPTTLMLILMSCLLGQFHLCRR